VLGLDGMGHAEQFADTSQWEAWQREQEASSLEAISERKAAPVLGAPSAGKRKLSYLEAREFAGLEERLMRAEELLQTMHANLQDPGIASDGPRLLAASEEVEKAEALVDQLYARWAELDAKQG
jgi:ABC transport system ATP-binding/permease protein